MATAVVCTGRFRRRSVTSSRAVLACTTCVRDLTVNPAVLFLAAKWVSDLMISAVKGYKENISPILPPACRFFPTCSQYAVEAIQTFGPQKGFVLMAWRILRCNPLGGSGYDPPRWPPVPFRAGS
mmetsp:Transcript_9976/g.42115  ORF Transcript_9976/g.42115 Transcript_9976/m.42115 type:complete len:125 (+) Transcript_9976:309-683(+)